MKSRLVTSLPAIVLLSAAAPVRGASLIANGEFTDSLAGWEQMGTVFNTGGLAVLSDAASLRTVVFQTAGVPAGAISLQLSFDLLSRLSSVAGLGQTRDSVFISAFLGSVPFGVNFDAGLFDAGIGILDADSSGFFNLAANLTSGPSPKGIGWTRFSMPLSPAPFATVAFEFIDGNGVTGDSTAAVDNVVLEAVFVPEPATSAFLMVCGLLLMRRRPRY